MPGFCNADFAGFHIHIRSEKTHCFQWPNPSLKGSRIRVSMDGRGRAFENILVGRQWQTVKCEEVYLNSYQTVREAGHGLERYFLFYNRDRLHQSLEYRTSAEFHWGLSPHWEPQSGGTQISTSDRIVVYKAIVKVVFLLWRSENFKNGRAMRFCFPPGTIK